MTDVTKAPDADELAERVRSLFAGNNTAGGITGPLSNGERYFILPQSSVEADHKKLSEARSALATHAAQIEALTANRDRYVEALTGIANAERFVTRDEMKIAASIALKPMRAALGELTEGDQHGTK